MVSLLGCFSGCTLWGGEGCMPEEGAGLPEQFGSPCGIGIAVAY